MASSRYRAIHYRCGVGWIADFLCHSDLVRMSDTLEIVSAYGDDAPAVRNLTLPT